MLYDTEVQSLVLEDRRVREAVLSSKGFPETVRARSVVAASGGFQANLEWLREYWGEAADNFVIRGTPYARGRVLRNLLDQGVAAVGDPTQFHAVALDARAPKFDGGIVTRLDCVPFCIVVNRHGERFYDEGEDVWPKRYAIWGRLIAQQPGQIAYSIVDAKAVRAVHAVGVPGVPGRLRSPSWPARSGSIPPRSRRPSTEYNAAVQPGHFDGTPSTTAPPPGSSRRRATGRGASTSRRSTAIRCAPASPSPISA